MILKGIKQEGRIRFYLMTIVLFVFGGAAWDLPKTWMKVIAILLLSGVYLYATNHIAKKFKYNQHKCKEVKIK